MSRTDEFRRFLAFRAVALSPSFRVEEGLGLVSVWPRYESARKESCGASLFRMKERKKKEEENLFDDLF